MNKIETYIYFQLTGRILLLILCSVDYKGA